MTTLHHRLAMLLGVLACGTGSAALADTQALAPRDGVIGYAMTNLFWSVYQTADGKSECPKGFNDGPREQYDKLWPGKRQRSVVDTQLQMEIETWHPSTEPDPLPFHEVAGKLSYGLNLDGQVSANDFTHPDGTPGIDNEVYRAVGCIIGFRGPDGVEVIFQDKAIADAVYNRTMVEISGVDDLVNDDEVTVTFYRGQDRLLTDATGNKIMAGGSQRIDTRWGRRLIQQTRGKISEGVLTSEPLAEVLIPWMNLGVPTFQLIRDLRLQLKLTPETAEGLIAGYADVETYYRQLIRNDSTHHLSNGQISGVSLYKSLRRLADGHPDADGVNTAISTALDAKFTQVFIQHPEGEQAKAALLDEVAKQANEQRAARGDPKRTAGTPAAR